jgi:hypothetical protein
MGRRAGKPGGGPQVGERCGPGAPDEPAEGYNTCIGASLVRKSRVDEGGEFGLREREGRFVEDDVP